MAVSSSVGISWDAVVDNNCWCLSSCVLRPSVNSLIFDSTACNLYQDSAVLDTDGMFQYQFLMKKGLLKNIVYKRTLSYQNKNLTYFIHYCSNLHIPNVPTYYNTGIPQHHFLLSSYRLHKSHYPGFTWISYLPF